MKNKTQNQTASGICGMSCCHKPATQVVHRNVDGQHCEYHLCDKHSGAIPPVKSKSKILSVRVESKVDESPDLSHLGEYSNTPKAHAIDRYTRAHDKTFRFFNPNWQQYEDLLESASNDFTRYIQSDYQRMESYNRGDWQMLGIIAKAEMQLGEGSPIQTIRSGGLWGIESDSGADYIKEVQDGQLAELQDELAKLGFTERQIKYAFKGVKRD